jgi:hypothetical protein|tara:strand:+ start:790 stop:1131 length:342 start_codon:yes stop_codon:yes gene_type:complete
MRGNKALTLFDLGEGLAQRDVKRARAAEAQHRAEVFHRAQAVAVELASAHPERTTHADAVYRRLIADGVDIALLGPAAGKLFVEGRTWVPTGGRIQSRRISNHGRQIMVWRLR